MGNYLYEWLTMPKEDKSVSKGNLFKIVLNFFKPLLNKAKKLFGQNNRLQSPPSYNIYEDMSSRFQFKIIYKNHTFIMAKM